MTTPSDAASPDAASPVPDAAIPEVSSREVTSPEVTSPEVTSPEVTGPEVTGPEVTGTVRAQVLVPTAARMRALGERLAALLQAGDLVVLSGPLGAGKTTLVQGIGAGMAVRGPITSPTFVIARVHPALRGGPALVHADAYRLGSRAEVDDLDLDTDLDSCVTVVEWGEDLVEDLAPALLHVTLSLARPPVPGAPAAGHAAPGAGLPPGAGVAPAAAATGDEPRLLAVTGRGERWAPAAPAIWLALAGGAGPRQPELLTEASD